MSVGDQNAEGKYFLIPVKDVSLSIPSFLQVEAWIDIYLYMLPNIATTKLWQTAKPSKVEKYWKTPLTKGKRSAIICKLSTRGHCESGHKVESSEKSRKSLKKTFQKPLDKNERVWYNSRALRESESKGFEKFLKTFRKPLDKLKRMWYNNQVAKNATYRSLTIEQQEIKVQAKSLVRKNLEFLWIKKCANLSRIRTHTQKSKRAKQARQTRV